MVEKSAAILPVTAAVLEDAEPWRRAFEGVRRLMAERMSEAPVLAVDREPGVWEPVGRFGRKG